MLNKPVCKRIPPDTSLTTKTALPQLASSSNLPSWTASSQHGFSSLWQLGLYWAILCQTLAGRFSVGNLRGSQYQSVRCGYILCKLGRQGRGRADRNAKAVGLLIMMYPILCKVRYELLHRSFREKSLWVQIGFSIVVNWIVAPFFMVCMLGVCRLFRGCEKKKKKADS